MDKLIRQFKEAKLPLAGYELHPGVTVRDPVKWREAMLKDIEEGPEGTRAKMGALRVDLETFLRTVETQ